MNANYNSSYGFRPRAVSRYPEISRTFVLFFRPLFIAGLGFYLLYTAFGFPQNVSIKLFPPAGIPTEINETIPRPTYKSPSPAGGGVGGKKDSRPGDGTG